MKQLNLLLLIACLSGSVLADTVVTVTTPVGSFDILMLEDDAPVTVDNFLGYVNRGDYDGTFIHRSLPGFVIQVLITRTAVSQSSPGRLGTA